MRALHILQYSGKQVRVLSVYEQTGDMRTVSGLLGQDVGTLVERYGPREVILLAVTSAERPQERWTYKVSLQEREKRVKAWRDKLRRAGFQGSPEFIVGR